MIQANELRIGNWYGEFGIPTQVTPSLILKLYQIEIAGKIPIDISPIPLTQEWLLKFGFEENFGFEKGNVDLRHDEDGYYEYAMQLQGLGTHIKFVHQLQNLYYALTGEELQAK